MDVRLERDNDALVGRNVNACNSGHATPSFGWLPRATGWRGWPILPGSGVPEGRSSGNATPSPALWGRASFDPTEYDLVKRSISVSSTLSANAGFYGLLRAVCRRAPWRQPGAAPPAAWPVALTPSWRPSKPLCLPGGFPALAALLDAVFWPPASLLRLGPAETPYRPALGQLPPHVGDRGHAVDHSQRVPCPGSNPQAARSGSDRPSDAASRTSTLSSGRSGSPRALISSTREAIWRTRCPGSTPAPPRRRAGLPFASSIWSSASACGTVRGKPSRMKPRLASA